MYISRPNREAMKARKRRLEQNFEMTRGFNFNQKFRVCLEFFKKFFINKYHYWTFLFIGFVCGIIPNLAWVFQKPVDPNVEFGSDLVLFEEDEKSPLVNMTDDGFLQQVYIPTQKSDRKRLTDIIEYQIVKGDTLSGIAGKFGISQKTVVDVNNLSSTQLLRVGTNLTIIPVDGLLYTVKANDNIPNIAKQFKADPEEVVRQNK